jgi:hypothetical protein
MIVPARSIVRASGVDTAVAPFASVTLTENWDVAGAVGVPLRTPAAGSKFKPGGSEPSRLHEYGLVPPEAENVAGVYGVPTTPLGSAGTPMTSPLAGETMAMTKCAGIVVAPRLSCTVMSNGNLPGWVGVPAMGPESGSRLRPGGSFEDEIPYVYGGTPPTAVNCRAG